MNDIYILNPFEDSSLLKETSQLICDANKLIGFCLRGILVSNELKLLQ